MPMAAAAMAPDSWSGFRKISSAEPLEPMEFDCPTSLLSAWCFFSVARKLQA
jgi:hypothetical protein